MIVTDDQIREEITKAITENKVMLFMKGTPDFPRCGFSARTVQALQMAGDREGARARLGAALA